MFSSRRFPAARCLALVALAAPLGACAGDTVRTLATEAGYGPRAVAAPDFVVESRAKAQPDFMAVGVDAPKRPVRAKNSEGQKALAAELEGARGRNEAQGRAAESAGRMAGKAAGKGSGAGAGPSSPPPE